MKRLLVTGASGLLGLHLALQENERNQVLGLVNRHGLSHVPFQIEKVDLSEIGRAEKVIDVFKPDLLIHCAAMANIDDCEKEPELAARINGELPGRLANLAMKKGFQMVHISTDAVFDGVRGNYSEEDQPNPLSVYARTKLAGEQAAAGENSQAIIARVNFYGWSLTGQRSLAEFFYGNLSAGKRVNGFTDVYFCPLMVADLCAILMKTVDAGLSGLYHVVSPEAITKYEFGRRIAGLFGLDAGLIDPVSVVDGGLTARRSPLLTLRTDKLRRDLKTELPELEAGLSRFHAQFMNGYPTRLQAMAT